MKRRLEGGRDKVEMENDNIISFDLWAVWILSAHFLRKRRWGMGKREGG